MKRNMNGYKKVHQRRERTFEGGYIITIIYRKNNILEGQMIHTKQVDNKGKTISDSWRIFKNRSYSEFKK